MYGFLQLQSQSAFTGCTLADIKLHLNVVDTSQDSYITAIFAAAVNYCERVTSLDFRTTTWKLVNDQFPIWANYNWMDRYGNYVYVYPMISEYAIGRLTQRWQEISLKRGPVRSITSVKYYDGANTLQTLDPTTYNFTTPSYFPGRLEPTTFFPVSYPRPDSVTIEFITGLSTVPDPLIHAIKLLCGTWYNMREDISYGPATVGGATGMAVECLLSQYTAVGA